MKKFFLLLALLPFSVFAADVARIAPAEAAKLVASGKAVLVDVREPAEWTLRDGLQLVLAEPEAAALAGHGLEEALKGVGHFLTAGSELLGEHAREFNAGVVADRGHLLRGLHHFLRSLLCVNAAQAQNFLRVLGGGLCFGILDAVRKQFACQFVLQHHHTLRVLDRHLGQTHGRFHVFSIEFVQVFIVCHLPLPLWLYVFEI
jgi:hypothetical protein